MEDLASFLACNCQQLQHLTGDITALTDMYLRRKVSCVEVSDRAFPFGEIVHRTFLFAKINEGMLDRVIIHEGRYVSSRNSVREIKTLSDLEVHFVPRITMDYICQFCKQ